MCMSSVLQDSAIIIMKICFKLKSLANTHLLFTIQDVWKSLLLKRNSCVKPHTMFCHQQNQIKFLLDLEQISEGSVSRFISTNGICNLERIFLKPKQVYPLGLLYFHCWQSERWEYDSSLHLISSLKRCSPVFLMTQIPSLTSLVTLWSPRWEKRATVKPFPEDCLKLFRTRETSVWRSSIVHPTLSHSLNAMSFFFFFIQ